LEGVSLYDKLHQDGSMTLKAACGVMWEIADAMHYMHSRSIVHGDIKSENILLIHAPQRRIKLLDFGLARVDIRKLSGTLEGTPQYMAPECVHGQAASAQSDIYALGILFYELLTGSPPFTGEVEDVLRMQLTKFVPKPSELLGESIDIRADELILRATAKSLDERHQDMGFFLYELKTLMNMLGMDTSRRRRTLDTTVSSARKRNRNGMRRTQGAAEIFEYAPIPLAAVDCAGKVQVANEAFAEFLGLDGDAASLDLTDSHLTEVYPALLDDLTYVSSSRSQLKRVIRLHDDHDGVVEVAVHLAAVPSQATVTAGGVYMTVHPLGRIRNRSE
jgi:serine/threonine protein kinase